MRVRLQPPLIVTVLVAGLVAGCGQKGPLRLPGPPAATAVPAPAPAPVPPATSGAPPAGEAQPPAADPEHRQREQSAEPEPHR